MLFRSVIAVFGFHVGADLIGAGHSVVLVEGRFPAVHRTKVGVHRRAEIRDELPVRDLGIGAHTDDYGNRHCQDSEYGAAMTPALSAGVLNRFGGQDQRGAYPAGQTREIGDCPWFSPGFPGFPGFLVFWFAWFAWFALVCPGLP